MKQFKEAVYKNNLYAIVMYYGSIHAYETKFLEVLEAKRPHQITFSSKGHCLHILLNHCHQIIINVTKTNIIMIFVCVGRAGVWRASTTRRGSLSWPRTTRCPGPSTHSAGTSGRYSLQHSNSK